MEAKNFTISRSKSRIARVDKKTSASNNRIITIKEGTLTLINGKLEAGRFIIDSNPVTISGTTGTDTNTQSAANPALNARCSSEEHPATTFDIIFAFPKADGIYHIEGNLTIKGIATFTSFDAAISICGDKLNATARLNVDCKKYKMSFYPDRFFKYIKDFQINNNIDLEVTLCAEAL